MPSKQGIIKSSGNVFEDIGLDNPREYLAKAELAYQINKLIQKRGLTQIEAGKLLGIDQPKISALSCGRLSGFSIERLFKYLIKLDQEIEIVIKPCKPGKKSVKNTPPSINVRYVNT